MQCRTSKVQLFLVALAEIFPQYYVEASVDCKNLCQISLAHLFLTLQQSTAKHRLLIIHKVNQIYHVTTVEACIYPVLYTSSSAYWHAIIGSGSHFSYL